MAKNKAAAADVAGAPKPMPRYKSHKIVEAFKIQAIETLGDGGAILDGGDTSALVDEAYVNKHAPEVGGYYVRYPDGYESWSPAEAFESGYHRYDDPMNQEESPEAHQERMAKEAAERAEFPTQKVRVRAEPGSQGLGLVVQRFAGGYECENMQPRCTYERELEAGDQIHIATLIGRDRDTYLRVAGAEPAEVKQ